MSLAIVFPGQGSQVKGMGEELFARYTDWVNIADEVLGYSIVDTCLKEEEKINQTLFTQPALYIVNALSYRAYVEDGGSLPEIVMGHSLGEYNALLVAEVFDFKTGLICVKQRATLMSKAVGGGMAAILGMEEKALVDLIKTSGEGIDVANYNSPGQYVISGPVEQVEAFEPVLKEAGARKVVKLNVSGAFHSRYMQDAKELFLEFIQNIDFKRPKLKVIANVTAEQYAGDIKETLASQIAGSVQWVNSVKKASDLGVSEFLELGPGKVLSGLIKRIQRG